MISEPPACPHCGVAPAAGRFCRHCGASLTLPPERALKWPSAPPPPSFQPSFQPLVHPQRREVSSALAVILATALMLVVLGIAATVILLVAGGDSSRTGVLTQSTATGPPAQGVRAP